MTTRSRAALSGRSCPGVRVDVPFTSSNRPTEGHCPRAAGESAFEKLKPVAAVLDDEPVLDARLLSPRMWMRERFFCTVYEAVKAMLPAGLWFKGGKRRVTEKYVAIASLAVPAEEAAEAAARKRCAPRSSRSF